jgi:hypothetical protein
VTKEERRAEWLRATLILNDLRHVEPTQGTRTLTITVELYGKIVEYLIDRKQANA